MHFKFYKNSVSNSSQAEWEILLKNTGAGVSRLYILLYYFSILIQFFYGFYIKAFRF